MPHGFTALGTRAFDLEALAATEHLEHLAHRLGAVTGGGREHQPDAIRFQLVGAAVALRPQLRPEARKVRQGGRAGEHRSGEHAERGEDAARLPLLRMLLRDMRDLVADDRSEFGLGVEVGEQAAVQVDEAAAGGEGVDGVVVEQHEGPLGVRQRAVPRDALAELVHIVLQLLVRVETVGLEDLLVRVARRAALLHRAAGGLLLGGLGRCGRALRRGDGRGEADRQRGGAGDDEAAQESRGHREKAFHRWVR